MAANDPILLFPIQFANTTRSLRVLSGASSEDCTFPGSGSLTVGRNYWISGDSAADSDGGEGGVGDLLPIFETCLEDHSLIATATAVLNSTTLRTTLTLSASAQLLWTHASSNLDSAYTFGWNPAADSSTGTTITSPQIAEGIWRPASGTSVDSRDQQTIVGGVSRAINGTTRTSRLALGKKRRDIGWMLVTQNLILQEYETSNTWESLERYWLNNMTVGQVFRFYQTESAMSSGTYGLYRLLDFDIPFARSQQFLTRWDVLIKAQRVN